MLSQLYAHVVAHRLKDYLYPFAARELEGRYKIRIACNNNHRSDCIAQGEPCHIQPHSHIDALLGEVQFEITVNQGTWRPD